MGTEIGPPPKPFRFAGLPAGIKRNGRPDLALIWSPLPCAYAAAYTANHVKAAPIQWNKRHLDPLRINAVLVNSGNANAATGRKGVEDCALIARSAERVLGFQPGRVALASTGVIGHRLPVERIRSAIPQLHSRLSVEGWRDFSRAIMTTDTRPKVARRDIRLRAGLASVMGFAKGAGMIGPRLVPPSPHGTMLAFVATDIAISPGDLRAMLAAAVEESFNRITVDGDMSTNDSVFLLSSGLVPVRRAEKARIAEAIHSVLTDLAMQIVSDGEGATKLVAIRVAGAQNHEEAEILARAIGGSPLVKTAVYGGDPNWGRILAAVGSTRVKIRPEALSISVGGHCLFQKGEPTGPAFLRSARRAMKSRSFPILVTVGKGKGTYTLFTTDLSHRYVTINARYE